MLLVFIYVFPMPTTSPQFAVKPLNFTCGKENWIYEILILILIQTQTTYT